MHISALKNISQIIFVALFLSACTGIEDSDGDADKPVSITDTLNDVKTPANDEQAPSSPTNLRVLGHAQSDSLSITWNASTDNAVLSGYRVLRDNIQITSALLTETSFTDTGVSAGQTYEYQVVAVDAAQNTANSNLLLASAASAPVAPVSAPVEPAPVPVEPEPVVVVPAPAESAPVEPAPEPVPAAPTNLTGYFVSTTGDDDNSGDEDAPWASIQASINKLQPGDILNIVDGTYFENLKPKVSGTANAPIVIRAVTPFNVIIDGNGSGRALDITEVSYLEFEGLKLRNSGESAVLQINSRDNQPATGNTDTHHISLRKIAVKGSCLNKNCNGALIGRSNDILLEDAWIYGAGRYTMSIYGSRNIVLRRIAIRWDQWFGDSYKPNDPRNAIGIYNTHDSLFENIVIVDSGNKPPGKGGDKGSLLLAGGDNGKTSPFINSSNNRFYGLVIHNNVGKAIELSSRKKAHDNNHFENGVVFGNTVRAVTIIKKVTNTTFNQMTFLDHPLEGYANWSKETSGNVLKNSIIADHGKKTFHGEVAESFNIVYNNSPNYPSGKSPGTGSLIIDPELAYVFRNDSTPLSANLGSDGKPRGANLEYRYNNGVETSQKLWPWLYEEEILKDFCDAATLSELGRVDGNSSKWCDSGKSLTRYLWEASTELACPADVCTQP